MATLRVTICVDKNAAYPEAFTTSQQEKVLPHDCKLRRVKYLNNIIEQDNRFLRFTKRKALTVQCFKRFQTAERTLEDTNAVNMMRNSPAEVDFPVKREAELFILNNYKSIPVAKRVDTKDMIILEAEHRPDSIIKRHFHESTVVSIHINGSLNEVFNRRSIECLSSSVLILPAGEVHADHYGRAGLHSLTISLKPRYAQFLEDHRIAFNRTAYSGERNIPPLVRRFFYEWKHHDMASLIIMEGFLLEIIGELIRDEVKVRGRTLPPFIRRARDYLHEHFAVTLSLSEVAAVAGVHPAYLARSFKKYYRCSIGEYIRLRRIEHASLELATSDKPLAQIAAEAGFFDQSHFGYVFKQHMKLTPSQYRREVMSRRLKRR